MSENPGLSVDAVVNPERVGLVIGALVRLRYRSGNDRPFRTLLDTTPEIIEADHVTGEDCFVLKVLARSMGHLEEVTGRISGLGAVTTSVVSSSPLARRALTAPTPTQAHAPAPAGGDVPAEQGRAGHR